MIPSGQGSVHMDRSSLLGPKDCTAINAQCVEVEFARSGRDAQWHVLNAYGHGTVLAGAPEKGT